MIILTGQIAPAQFVKLDIILPIGLSFHVFQSIAYSVEVYRGKIAAERSFINFALYIMFYPQLVAGPIERPQHLLPQFSKNTLFNIENIKSGIFLMGIGFYKKIIIADYIAETVNNFYTNYTSFSGVSNLIAMYLFAIQLYCDFSGYSDIARGAAKTMGIDLMINFKQPFWSNNIKEFWHRWHISLSSWFKDYLYIPLGGSRKNFAFNLLLCFILSGLWHGAGWNFIIWGLLNGFGVLAYHLVFQKNIFSKFCPRIFAPFLTFTFFSFTLVFFRAPNFDVASTIITNIISSASFNSLNLLIKQESPHFIILLLTFMSMLIIDYLQIENSTFFKYLNKKNIASVLVLWSLSVLFILTAFLSLLNRSLLAKPFIYFQF